MTARFARLYDLPVPPSRAAQSIQRAMLPGLDDVVCAYDCLGLYGRIPDLEAIESLIRDLPDEVAPGIAVPVCFELGHDLQTVSDHLQITPHDLILAFLAPTYYCFAVGFTPGFPYLGYLDDRITGQPRLSQPRAHTEPGSVGITGRQTGIYPNDTPGGWPIIARCPRTVVDLPNDYFAFEAGIQVRFERIDDADFSRQLGWRLT
jgi:inhibitor of KinA